MFARTPILSLLSYKQFVLAMMSGSFGYFLGSFVEPILALRLKEAYSFKDSVIALFFVIHFFGYLVASPLVQFIPKKIDKKLIMIFGLLVAFATLVFYGPSKFLGIPEDWHFMLVGLILIGFAITLCLVPALPEMIHAVEKDFDNTYKEVNDVASGVFNTALGVGQLTGPFLGSFLTNSLGFRETTDILSIYAISFAGIYLIFGGGFTSIVKLFRDLYGLKEPKLSALVDPGDIELDISIKNK